MKKILLIIATAMFFIACEGPEGPVGPQGPTGRPGEGGVSWYNTAITVYADEWELKGNPDDLNSYFVAYKDISAMNDYIYRNGTVIAYLQTDNGVKNGMPYVLHRGAEENGKEFLWTQTYDFDFDKYGVGFYVTYSDFSTKIRPGTETFHVVLMW